MKKTQKYIIFDFKLTQTPYMQEYMMHLPFLFPWSANKKGMSLKLVNLYNSTVSIFRTISFSPWLFEL